MLNKILWACVGLFTPVIVMSLAALFWRWFSEQHKLVKKAWVNKSANTKQKPITFGNGYCALACPYIKPDKPETLSAECLLDGKNIIYQDWFIAHCLNEKHGARNEQ